MVDGANESKWKQATMIECWRTVTERVNFSILLYEDPAIVDRCLVTSSVDIDSCFLMPVALKFWHHDERVTLENEIHALTVYMNSSMNTLLGSQRILA